MVDFLGHKEGDMIDTLATAQTLTKSGIERAHAEAITAAVNQASDQGVTLGELDVQLSALELRMVRWLIGAVGLQTALVFGIVRFFH